MVEKSLKVALFSRGLEFRRTHDLFELANRLQAAGVALPCDVDTLGQLNPYAVLFRYDSPDGNLLPLAEAEQIAASVLSWAQSFVASASE